MRLESHEQYHLGHPLLKAIEYWITPSFLTTVWAPAVATQCKSPLAGRQLASLRLVSNSTSLGFCYLTLKQSHV